jgi:hypothetical protein
LLHQRVIIFKLFQLSELDTGEIVTDSYFGTNNQLTQGFQQPMESYAGIETEEVQGAFTVYPNPSRNTLYISAQNTTEQYSLTLTDLTGQIILTESYNANMIHTYRWISWLQAYIYCKLLIPTVHPLKFLKFKNYKFSTNEKTSYHFIIHCVSRSICSGAQHV